MDSQVDVRFLLDQCVGRNADHSHPYDRAKESVRISFNTAFKMGRTSSPRPAQTTVSPHIFCCDMDGLQSHSSTPVHVFKFSTNWMLCSRCITEQL